MRIWFYGGPLHGDQRTLPDGGRVTQFLVEPDSWDASKPRPSLRYLRVPRGAYQPPADYEPFVYEDWVALDRAAR